MTDRRPKLLIVDDRDRYAELAHALLRQYDYATRCELRGPCWECASREGCTLTHAHDWAETVQALAKHPDLDLILLDLDFELPPERLLLAEHGDVERSKRLQGIEILRHLRQRFGAMPVVLMTSEKQLQFEDAADQLRVDEFVVLAGADVFDARAIALLIERVLSRRRAWVEGSGYIWGNAAAMARLRRDALSLARTSLPMLLVGETGTGKSALAELALHPLTRRKGPFVAVDLAAIPATLVAAELFGTVPGAFSGATDRKGRFEQAHGGTLLLDEIGNLPPEVQRSLLLVLQSGRVTRLGEGTPRSVDVKLLAATNTDLEAAVRQGAFRADLYARLNPLARLVLPPLRDRVDDIEELADAFVRKAFGSGPNHDLLKAYLEASGLSGSTEARLAVDASEAIQDAVVFSLSRRTLSALRAHSWPGNIRELESLVVSAAVFSLNDALSAAERQRAQPGQAIRSIPVSAKLVRELLDASWSVARPRVPSESERGIQLQIRPAASLRELCRELERQALQVLFRENAGDFGKMAARLLQGDPAANARRVRLRLNQLGLRVRELRKNLSRIE